MGKILDPDLLIVDTELVLDTVNKTFSLVATGNLVAKDGVSAQALYSKFVDLWTTAAYNKYPFPGYVIGDPRAGMFVWGFDGATYNGWKPLNDVTRQRIRDAGWAEYSSAGVLNRQYVGVVSLGDVSAAAQLYYQRTSTSAPANFTFNDEVNEAIQVYGDASNGNFDERTYFKMFCREYSKSYASANLTLIGETGTGPYKIGMPIANTDDLKIVDNDATVAAITGGNPYPHMKIRYFSGTYSRDVDLVGTARDFGIVIDIGTHSGIDGSMGASGTSLSTSGGGIPTDGTFDGGTLTVHEGTNKGTYTIGTVVSATAVPITTTFPTTETNSSFSLQRVIPIVAEKTEIYTWIQYQLRQNSDIDSTAGSVTGKTADIVLSFAGDQLEAGKFIPTNLNGGGTGVFIEGFKPDDATTIDFYDNGGSKRNFPFNATGVFTFNSFLIGGTGYYRMYFTDLDGASDYGFTGAVTVNDKDDNPIVGVISSSSISWSFDYDTNTQGGRTAGTNAAVTIVAGRPGYAKPVVTTHTITRTSGQIISLISEMDRGYLNP